MLKSQNGVVPEFDDRRELWNMLTHLTPARRLEWLKWCCREVSGGGVTTYVEKNDGSVKAIWSDMMTLCYGSGLTIRRAGDKLHRMVKGRE